VQEINLVLDEDHGNVAALVLHLALPGLDGLEGRAVGRREDDDARLKIPGLPDDIFSNQTSQFGLILEGLAMEDVDIFYGHLAYFTGHLVYFIAIWYNLCPFGTFYGSVRLMKFPLQSFLKNRPLG
jgi:hypothetical protein